MAEVSVKGFLDLTQEPPVITVQGSLIVYRDDDAVEVSRVEADESEPSLLVLQARISEGVFPMKGVTRCWVYQERGAHVRSYTHVIVRGIEGGSETAEVQVPASKP
jgi:hypothetical protein